VGKHIPRWVQHRLWYLSSYLDQSLLFLYLVHYPDHLLGAVQFDLL
jgi:hypothetical protein